MKTNILSFSPQLATIELPRMMGEIDREAFRSQLILTLLDRTTSILLIDMKQVEFLDSAGLMVLISAYRLAIELDRRLSFCSVTPSVRMIFELTQLDKKFEIFENRQAFDLTLA